MKVILLETVRGLGRKGDVIETKEGYFQNFLAPRKLAKIATDGAIKEASELKKKQVIELEKNNEDAKLISDKINNATYVIRHKADGDKLYAKVGVNEVIEILFNQSKIRLKEKHFPTKLEIKTLGKHSIELSLGTNVKARIILDVQPA